jgi:hypothetical protein
MKTTLEITWYDHSKTVVRCIDYVLRLNDYIVVITYPDGDTEEFKNVIAVKELD